MLFGHGDDHYNSQKEVKINFSSNVWHGADLRTLREHLNEQFYELTRYPEPDASSLKRLLARCYEVEEENIVVTNGSITAFYLLAQTWKGAKSAIAVPSFAEYEDACRLHGHEVSFFPTSCDLSGLSLEGQDFCWICNPNNPDGRLIRRMVRDARTRGASAKHTISMWPSVRRGEDQYIFPFQEEADVMFNSALIYELAVLKPYAESILFGIPKDVPEYVEAKRLLKFLDYFIGVSTEEIPKNSLMREFVGGSIFRV